jgi:hypothetical protein
MKIFSDIEHRFRGNKYIVDLHLADDPKTGEPIKDPNLGKVVDHYFDIIFGRNAGRKLNELCHETGNHFALLDAHGVYTLSPWHYADGNNRFLVQDWVDQNDSNKYGILAVNCCNKDKMWKLTSQNRPIFYPLGSPCIECRYDIEIYLPDKKEIITFPNEGITV